MKKMIFIFVIFFKFNTYSQDTILLNLYKTKLNLFYQDNRDSLVKIRLTPVYEFFDLNAFILPEDFKKYCGIYFSVNYSVCRFDFSYMENYNEIRRTNFSNMFDTFLINKLKNMNETNWIYFENIILKKDSIYYRITTGIYNRVDGYCPCLQLNDKIFNPKESITIEELKQIKDVKICNGHDSKIITEDFIILSFKLKFYNGKEDVYINCDSNKFPVNFYKNLNSNDSFVISIDSAISNSNNKLKWSGMELKVK